MASRTNLQEELEALLESENVYFNPPESVQLSFPCIIYSLDEIDIRKAGNKVYLKNRRYEVIHISDDPDDTLPEKILEHFANCSYTRQYKAENLYHNVLQLYY